MEHRYFIYLAYNGANYCGWQSQPNGISIQESLEKALSTILRKEIAIVGAGRTDAGVHARQMVAHFDVNLEGISTSYLSNKLNSFLSKDIAIHKIVEVKPDAHARFDAISRLYRYYIITEKDPFCYDTHCRIRETLDLENMNKCAQLLLSYDDFTSFSKLHTDVKTNLCKITKAEWVKHDNEYIFTIEANRFLRNMVRAIVGTLLEAGRNRLDIQGMKRIIEAKDRSVAGKSVFAKGLFLENIEYPSEIFDI